VEPERITPHDVHRRLEAGERIVLLDSRSAKAWAESDVTVPGAIRVPPDEVEQHLGEIPRDGLIVTYCT
jgi:rhodanese-related sulfurtransferase